jgi:hypothetical protein
MYVDITNATGSGLLGLTVGCAQCHDHKFDAITHKDYYRLQGFFLSGMPYNFALRDPAGWKKYSDAKPAEYDDARMLRDKLLERGRVKLDEKGWKGLTPDQRAALKVPSDERSPEQHALAVESHLAFQYTLAQVENAIPQEDRTKYVELKKKVAAMEAKLPDPPQTYGFYSPISSPHRIDALPMKGFYPPKFDAEELGHAKPFRLLAGDSKRRGEKLAVGWPAMFGPSPQVVEEKPTRTALAKWLTAPAHPLTARVWVNRIWHYHFGRGIVDSPSDFGLRGARPTHPELLDWLASELVNPHRQGGGEAKPWATKHIHRLIVTSATYRQSAQGQPTSVELDPENVFLSRWKPRRLEAEAVRDSMLVVSGELDAKIGGAPDINEEKSLRRGIYQLMRRQKPPMGLTLFDGPTAATESCPKRITTVTPLHALFILNNDFPAARAKAFANRVRKIAGKDFDKQVETAFLIALHRKPKPSELEAVARFFKNAPDATDMRAEMCHALMATVEFMTMQ